MNDVKKFKQEVYVGNDSSGISIRYIKNRRVLYIHGWYDRIAGIEGAEIELGKFLQYLGVSVKDCKEALDMKFIVMENTNEHIR